MIFLMYLIELYNYFDNEYVWTKLNCKISPNHFLDVCIACFGSDVDVVAEHPLFEGGLCLECKEELQESIFAFGNDGKNVNKSYIYICFFSNWNALK